MAIYQCRGCREEQVVPRPWRYHFGPETRCPQCGTQRLTKLQTPDRIDPKHTGFLNLLERLMGGKLYHCRFCRIQFYDRRGASPAGEAVAESHPAKESDPSTERTA